ncbi:MAG: helix-turn-helix domain-containing protein [Clostridiales bacterium]|nr:helix-turn-helix domain-containing protein [Clostridiales bacterium]
MNDKIRDPLTDELFDAILSLRNRDECYRLFEDLCTVSEIKSLASRLRVALLLSKGHTYSEILELTGVSTATISRVNRCLEYGADGYKTVLDRIGDNHNLPDGKGTYE